MQFDQFESEVFLVFIASHMSLFLAGGILLLVQHKGQRDRSRIFIGSFFLAMTFACSVFITTALSDKVDAAHYFNILLEPYPSIILLLIWVLVPFYLLEIMRPNWLNIKYAAYILTFWAVCALVFIGWHTSIGFDELTELHSIDEVLDNIQRTDVALRVMLALMYIPYGVMVFFMHSNWRRSNAPMPWMRALTIITFSFTVTFVSGMLLRIPIMMLLHLLMTDLVGICVLVLEFRVRIPVPESVAEDKNIPEEDEEEKIYPELVQNDLTYRLKQLIDDGIWRNPELQMEDLCRSLVSNRTYVSGAIQELGYTGFTHMVNRNRVEYIHKQLEQDYSVKVLDLFFQAGYRSRNTAARSFQKEYGCSAQEYRNKLLKEMKYSKL